MRVESSNRWYREDLRTVDHGGGVVADDGEDAHDELEITLQLGLVGCDA